jgi:putative membrane protein
MGKLLKGKIPILLLLVMSLSAHAQSAPAQAGMWGDGWHGGWGWGHMFFGSFMMLFFLGGFIILVVLAVRWMGGGSPRVGDGPAQRNRALDIIDERYARGEIDKEEYEERRRLLSK